MPLTTYKSALPRIQIDNPKKKDGSDLSDHHPIVINGEDFKVVSYNIQLMPMVISQVADKKTPLDMQRSVNEITEYFSAKDADVCCVQELFDNTANSLMEKAMRQKGYVATARVGAKALPIFNGGARTFVKKELAQNLNIYEHIYQNTLDYTVKCDAVVNKGVTHVCFTKSGKKHHIFNTHLQAYYPDRDHYAEVTLTQCVELKKFIESQTTKGIIGPDDTIIMCGDFNIPKPHSDEEASLLYLKMSHFMGPQFTFLDYDQSPSGPKYTLSLQNSYNRDLPKSSDNDVNVDMAILYSPNIVDSSPFDSELSEVYCDIQLAIYSFIKKHATLFSQWLLSADKILELQQFNLLFTALIIRADAIKLLNVNPMDDQAWRLQAVKLLQGPGATDTRLTKTILNEFIADIIKAFNMLDSLDITDAKTLEAINSLKSNITNFIRQLLSDLFHKLKQNSFQPSDNNEFELEDLTIEFLSKNANRFDSKAIIEKFESRYIHIIAEYIDDIDDEKPGYLDKIKCLQNLAKANRPSAIAVLQAMYRQSVKKINDHLAANNPPIELHANELTLIVNDGFEPAIATLKVFNMALGLQWHNEIKTSQTSVAMRFFQKVKYHPNVDRLKNGAKNSPELRYWLGRYYEDRTTPDMEKAFSCYYVAAIKHCRDALIALSETTKKKGVLPQHRVLINIYLGAISDEHTSDKSSTKTASTYYGNGYWEEAYMENPLIFREQTTKLLTNDQFPFSKKVCLLQIPVSKAPNDNHIALKQTGFSFLLNEMRNKPTKLYTLISELTHIVSPEYFIEITATVVANKQIEVEIRSALLFVALKLFKDPPPSFVSQQSLLSTQQQEQTESGFRQVGFGTQQVVVPETHLRESGPSLFATTATQPAANASALSAARVAEAVF